MTLWTSSWPVISSRRTRSRWPSIWNTMTACQSSASSLYREISPSMDTKSRKKAPLTINKNILHLMLKIVKKLNKKRILVNMKQGKAFQWWMKMSQPWLSSLKTQESSVQRCRSRTSESGRKWSICKRCLRSKYRSSACSSVIKRSRNQFESDMPIKIWKWTLINKSAQFHLSWQNLASIPNLIMLNTMVIVKSNFTVRPQSNVLVTPRSWTLSTHRRSRFKKEKKTSRMISPN